MKYLIVISVILISINAFSQNHNQVSSTNDLQSKYFPIQIRGVFINMKLEDLLQQRPAIQRDDVTSGDNLGYYDEYFDEGKIVNITYQVDDKDIMYEMIFQYNDSTTNDLLREEMIKKFGTPNAAEEDMPYQWSATVSENLKLLFWVYQNKFCIADASKF